MLIKSKLIAGASAASSTVHSDYSYGIVYQLQLEYFVAEIPPWLVSLFRKGFFKYLVQINVVPVV